MARSKKKTDSLDNLKPLLEERGELYEEKKAIEDEIKKLDETLRPMLEGRGAVTYAGHQFEVRLNEGRKSFDRKKAEAFIEDNGGKVSGSISSKTSYIVAGDNMGPSKRVKAEQLNIPIITEENFLQMII